MPASGSSTPCFEYLKASKDSHDVRDDAAAGVPRDHRRLPRGTRINIKMDPADGLVTQGDANTQLTWMDAKCDGVAFTPRQGKAVEINALWYNALVLMGDERAGRRRCARVFARRSGSARSAGCATSCMASARDATIRPNQIFAVSLPQQPADDEQQSAVVEVVRRELLTPCRAAHARAERCPATTAATPADQFQRDAAYHNGTIWPWLIGAFLEAYLKVNERSPSRIAQAREWLQPLIDSMANQSGASASISEIFEAAAAASAGRVSRAGVERRGSTAAGDDAGNVMGSPRRTPRRTVRIGCVIFLISTSLLVVPLFVARGAPAKYFIAFGVAGACLGVSVMLNATLDWLRGAREATRSRIIDLAGAGSVVGLR